MVLYVTLFPPEEDTPHSLTCGEDLLGFAAGKKKLAFIWHLVSFFEYHKFGRKSVGIRKEFPWINIYYIARLCLATRTWCLSSTVDFPVRQRPNTRARLSLRPWCRLCRDKPPVRKYCGSEIVSYRPPLPLFQRFTVSRRWATSKSKKSNFLVFLGWNAS